MVGPQDTYEAGLNGNEVPNPGTNILTTNHHIYIYIWDRQLEREISLPSEAPKDGDDGYPTGTSERKGEKMLRRWRLPRWSWLMDSAESSETNG